MSHDNRAVPGSAVQAVLVSLFFASGFVALLYQVIWQRLLGLVTGLDLYAVTLIVAVFMFGMGAGSFVGGALADRLPVRRLLALFAISEAVIALFALGSTWLYHDLLYSLAVAPGASSTLIAMSGAATLLVPTFFMGVTLPVLSRALAESLTAAPARIARLYGWNTVGAAMGAWVGSALVIRTWGYDRSLWLGAAVNLAAAATTWWLASRMADTGQAHVAITPEVAAPIEVPRTGPPATSAVNDRVAPLDRGAAAWSWRTWVALYFVSGFIALGLELVWFRLLGVILKSTAFTFPLLLGFYLLGVGGGSLIGRSFAARCARPTRWFLIAQAAAGLYAGLSVALLIWGLQTVPQLEPARGYLSQYDPIDFAFNFLELKTRQLALYIGGPALLILPPTVLMGISFALLQRGVQRNLAEVGRRVAALQTANILGSTLGTIVVGLVLIDRIGTSGTLQWLTAGSGLFLALAAIDRFASHGRGLRVAAATAGVAVAAVSAWAIPSASTFWGQLHAVPESRIIHQEDGTGLAVLTSPDPFFRRRTDVYVNGLGQSTIPFNGVHSFLGLVPALLHPAPKRIAIIGLGSGDTWYSAAGRPETDVIECVEIIGGQIETLRTLHARTGYVGLDVLFSDPRFRFTVGDGRRLVMQSEQPFDIIEADALRPSSAYSGNLYSREYFELLRDRLAPGGLAVTWAPTPRITETFVSVFPHVAEVSPMLIGSNGSIAFDPVEVRARATRAETARHYTQAGIDLETHLEQMLSTFRHVSQGASPSRPPEHLLNTDLFPRDELQAR